MGLTWAIGVASVRRTRTRGAFQARDAGSIPVTRSTSLPVQRVSRLLSLLAL